MLYQLSYASANTRAQKSRAKIVTRGRSVKKAADAALAVAHRRLAPVRPPPHQLPHPDPERLCATAARPLGVRSKSVRAGGTIPTNSKRQPDREMNSLPTASSR